MRAQPVEALERRQGEDDDPAVGPARHEEVVGELQLADEGRVALQQSEAVTEKGRRR